MIDDFKQRFNLGKDFVVVADSGLMNKNNVTLLREAGYNYILGARIKSESASVKQWILSLEKVDKACYDYKRENGERLIVSYSDKRAKKDAYNRDRGIVRLRKAQNRTPRPLYPPFRTRFLPARNLPDCNS